MLGSNLNDDGGALKDKYKELLELGVELGVKDGDVKVEGGKLHVSGTAIYQYDKDRLWDKIKSYANWENEVSADINVENTEIYGTYEVQRGDSLSKIAKSYYGDPMYLYDGDLEKGFAESDHIIEGLTFKA